MPTFSHHHETSEVLVERAALAALGLLSPEDERAFQTHVAEGCPACAQLSTSMREAAAALAFAAPPSSHADVDAEAALSRVKIRLMARVAASARPRARSDVARPSVVQRDSPPSARVVRSEQLAWRTTEHAGVRVRRLRYDRATRQLTLLMRMEAGCEFPEHDHTGAEDTYVLEGDLQCGSLSLMPGDLYRAAAGSSHERQWTRDGCLVLVMTELNEFGAA